MIAFQEFLGGGGGGGTLVPSGIVIRCTELRASVVEKPVFMGSNPYLVLIKCLGL